MSTPLLFFVVTKPGYEKLPQSPTQEKKTKATFKHSAKPNDHREPKPTGDLVSAPTPPDTASRSG